MFNKEQDLGQLNDFFTATIVGAPQTIRLGQAFVPRTRVGTDFVSIETVLATAWLSEPAHTKLSQSLKRNKRTMGVPFPVGTLPAQFDWRQSTAVFFVLGFLTCSLLHLAYLYMKP